jgi:protein-tyrosine kinase
MEKIKEALSKAKHQYSKYSSTKTNESQSIERKSTRASIASDEELDGLKYTQTKVVPLNRLAFERNRIVAHDKSNPLSAVFDLLRTEVLAKMEANNWKSIAIVSPTPESGKSFVSINLAMSIAHQPNKSVILVDFDLRRPKIASYMGILLDKSLNDYLSGDIELSEALVNPSIPRLVVLAPNKPVSKSSELLSSRTVEELVTEIRNRYESRITIYDLPPILNVDDSRVMIPQVDCVLMVIANGQNNPAEIVQSYSLIPKEKFLGYVFNKAEQTTNAYYY